GRDRPVISLPRRAAGLGDHLFAVIAEAGKEVPPFGSDRGRIFLIAGVQLFDEGGIATIKKRRVGERVVLLVLCHCALSRARPARSALFGPVWPHMSGCGRSVWLLEYHRVFLNHLRP